MTIEDIITLLDAMETLDDRQPIRDGLEELGVASEGAQARIAELEHALSESESRYTDAAARNWELTQAVTVPSEPNDEGAEDEYDDTDDLFEED